MGYCDLCCQVWQFKLLNLITCSYLNYSCNKNEKSTQANKTIYCSLSFMAKNSHNYAKAFMSRIHIFCKKNLISKKLDSTSPLFVKIQLQIQKVLTFLCCNYIVQGRRRLGDWFLAYLFRGCSQTTLTRFWLFFNHLPPSLTFST